MILLLVLIAASEVMAGAAIEAPANKSTKLVEKIRRQLMENNYDYLPTEDEWYLQAKHYDQDGPNDPLYDEQPQARDFEAEEKRRREEERYDSQDSNRDGSKTGTSSRTNVTHKSEFVPRAAPTNQPNPYGYDNLGNQVTTNKEPQSDGFAQFLERNQMSNLNNINYIYNQSNNEMSKRKSADPTVSKNDLLYYMDETKMKTSFEVNDVPSNPDAAGGGGTKAKYKVIKVKNANPYRRNNVVRRFIQEETPEGVAIISLDGSPFPEFHLPRARRQYMLDRDTAELSDDRRVGPQRRDEAPIYDEQSDILEENRHKEHYRKRYRYGSRKHRKRTRNNIKNATKNKTTKSTNNKANNNTTININNNQKNNTHNNTNNNTINNTANNTNQTKINTKNDTKIEIINIQRRSADVKIDPKNYKPYSNGPRYI